MVVLELAGEEAKGLELAVVEAAGSDASPSFRRLLPAAPPP